MPVPPLLTVNVLWLPLCLTFDRLLVLKASARLDGLCCVRLSPRIDEIVSVLTDKRRFL